MTWSTNVVELTPLDLHNNSSRSVLISPMLQIKVELKEIENVQDHTIAPR